MTIFGTYRPYLDRHIWGSSIFSSIKFCSSSIQVPTMSNCSFSSWVPLLRRNPPSLARMMKILLIKRLFSGRTSGYCLSGQPAGDRPWKRLTGTPTAASERTRRVPESEVTSFPVPLPHARSGPYCDPNRLSEYQKDRNHSGRMLGGARGARNRAQRFLSTRVRKSGFSLPCRAHLAM